MSTWNKRWQKWVINLLMSLCTCKGDSKTSQNYVSPLEQSLVKYLRTDFQTYIYAKYVAHAAAPRDTTSQKKGDKYGKLHTLNTTTADAQRQQQFDTSQALATFAQASSRGEKPQQRGGWSHSVENSSLGATRLRSTGHNRTDVLEPTTAWTGARVSSTV